MPQTPITHPAQLKGMTCLYRGKKVQVKDTYLLHGQLIIETEVGSPIKINKSIIKEEMKQFSWTNSNQKPTNRIKQSLGKAKPAGLVNPTDPAADTYYWTRDYGKFAFNHKNRPPNTAHVNNLVVSIKENNLLFAQPILVNHNYEIIDGQHRFLAAKRLDARLYYIIKPGLSIEDAIALNINTKNWGYKDYLHYWIEQGNENYVYFQEFLDEYGISYSLSAGLLMLGNATSGNYVTKEFNNGNLEINHRDYAENIGRLLLELQEYGNFTTDRSFVIALHQAIQFGEFDQAIFKSKVTMCPDKFTKCSDTDSYLRMMEDVINYHGRGQRIRLY